MKSEIDIRKMVSNIENTIDELKDQKEHNKSNGQYQIAKAIDDTIKSHYRDKRLLQIVLEEQI